MLSTMHNLSVLSTSSKAGQYMRIAQCIQTTNQESIPLRTTLESWQYLSSHIHSDVYRKAVQKTHL